MATRENRINMKTSSFEGRECLESHVFAPLKITYINDEAGSYHFSTLQRRRANRTAENDMMMLIYHLIWKKPLVKQDASRTNRV